MQPPAHQVPDLLLRIFAQLDRNHLSNLNAVCRVWHNCVQEVHRSRACRTLIVGNEKDNDGVTYQGWDIATGPLGQILIYKTSNDPYITWAYPKRKRKPPLIIVNGHALKVLSARYDYILTCEFAFQISPRNSTGAVIVAIYHQPRPSTAQLHTLDLVRKYFQRSVAPNAHNGLQQLLTRADSTLWMDYLAELKRIAAEKTERLIAFRREQQELSQRLAPWVNSSQYIFTQSRCTRKLQDRVSLLQQMGSMDKAAELVKEMGKHSVCSGNTCSLQSS